jgi:hypothetical protein
MIKVVTVALVTSVNLARTARLKSHETSEIETSFMTNLLTGLKGFAGLTG